MRNEPKELEKKVIEEVINILKESCDLHKPTFQHLESPDFLITDGTARIGVELVSYSVDAKASTKGIESKSRKKFFSGKAQDDNGGWVGISAEVIELIKDKAASYSRYKTNSKSDECWLILHSENLMHYEELGSKDMAPFQNVNFTAVIQHYLDKVPFERVYLYDMKNRTIFGGVINLLASKSLTP